MFNRARGFLANHPRAEWLIPAALCIILLVQLLLSVRQMSQHADEAVHMHAGYRVLKCSDYAYGREHPPLAKMLVTAPLLWSKAPMDCGGTAKIDEEEQATSWLYSQPEWWRLLMEARAVSSLFAAALCFAVWVTARRIFGLAVAALSTSVLVFEPNILAHGALLLNDILVSTLFLLAVFCFYLWSRQRSVPRLAATGFCLGLALLTKYSAVLLIALLILLALADAWLETNNKKEAVARTLRNFGAVAAILVIAAAIIWCGFGLRYAEGGQRASDSSAEQQLSGMRAADVQIVKAMRTAHLLPKAYLHGYLDVRGLVDTTGDGVYLLGRPHSHSPWFFFPLSMTVKFTLAFLAMLAMGCAGLILFGRERRRELVFLLLPVLLYLAASTRVQRTASGIWHLFPMLPFLLIAIAVGCISLARRYRWASGALVCLLALHAASSLRAYPNYLSYANEAWGGPRNLYKILPWTDLNQSYWQVSRYMEKHPDTPCWITGEWRVPASSYKVPCTQMGNYFEAALPEHMKGIVFISGSWYELWGQPGGPYAPFYALQPKALLGGSAMLVYEGEFDTRVAAARALDNRVRTFLWARDLRSALLTAKEAVEMAPNTATAHDSYCLALLGNGYLEQALGECSLAQKLALPDLEGQRLANDFAYHLDLVKQVKSGHIPPELR